MTLLATLSQMEGVPAWVRFLLTLRDNDQVLQQFQPLPSHKLNEMLEQNLGDIRQYVQKRVEQPAFQPRLETAQVTLSTLVEEVKSLSKGNFLYTRLLLNDIEAGRQSLENLAELPKSLDEIYHNFLRRFSEREWEEEYQPILGTLSVVLEPITEELLVKFTEVDSDELQEDLDVLQQFLDVAKDEQKQLIYAIFHQSLRGYLLDKTRNKDFWCDAKEHHAIIVDCFEEESESWQNLEKIEPYGLRHLAQQVMP